MPNQSTSHGASSHDASSTIIVGTRGSALAMVQTALVTGALSQRIRQASLDLPDAVHREDERHRPEPVEGQFDRLSLKIRRITTHGDRDQQSQLSSMGTQGVFTGELERALLAGEIDVAVHSFKDLPTDDTEGLIVAAVLVRGNPFDALVLSPTHYNNSHGDDVRERSSLAALPAGARVGVGSPRRREALRCVRDDLELTPVRGNVDTRLAKLRDGRYDALVMARAALDRLGRTEKTESLENVMLPAPAQGAIAVQVRASDESTRQLMAAIHDADAGSETAAEREALRLLGGGCHLPLGVLGRTDGSGRMILRAQVYLRDKADTFEVVGPTEDGSRLAAQLVEKMRASFPDLPAGQADEISKG